jgi:hypothetical protein
MMRHWRLVAACLGLSAASLLLPSEPSYDPWAWLQWGREIAFLDLHTSNGPSWKPLPVMFTLLFSPFAKLDDAIPPALWLVTARCAALLALVLAYRVAARLAGPQRRAAAGAGALAAVALLLSPEWLRYMAHGNEAPMAVAFMLGAVMAHLDGGRRRAVVLGFLACLLRPEVFPFLALYAALTLRAEPRSWRLVLALGAALPVLWLVPEWIGSGDPFGAARQAASEPSWSLSLRDQPWLAVLERWQNMVGLPLEAAAAVAVGFAVRRRERVTLALAALAVAWLALIVGMTQAGFSGNGRYLLPALVIVSLLAACGAARTVALASARGMPAGAVAAVLIAVAAAPFVSDRVTGFRAQADSVGPLARLHHQLGEAVERVGGPNAVTPYGAATVNRKFDTHLAWELKVPIGFVEVGRGDGVVFMADGRLSGTPAVLDRPRQSLRTLAHVGGWEVGRAADAGIQNAPERTADRRTAPVSRELR